MILKIKYSSSCPNIFFENLEFQTLEFFSFFLLYCEHKFDGGVSRIKSHLAEVIDLVICKKLLKLFKKKLIFLSKKKKERKEKKRKENKKLI